MRRIQDILRKPSSAGSISTDMAEVFRGYRRILKVVFVGGQFVLMAR
jgi:hypothetical protein